MKYIYMAKIAFDLAVLAVLTALVFPFLCIFDTDETEVNGLTMTTLKERNE